MLVWCAPAVCRGPPDGFFSRPRLRERVFASRVAVDRVAHAQQAEEAIGDGSRWPFDDAQRERAGFCELALHAHEPSDDARVKEGGFAQVDHGDRAERPDCARLLVEKRSGREIVFAIQHDEPSALAVAGGDGDRAGPHAGVPAREPELDRRSVSREMRRAQPAILSTTA